MWKINEDTVDTIKSRQSTMQSYSEWTFQRWAYFEMNVIEEKNFIL